MPKPGGRKRFYPSTPAGSISVPPTLPANTTPLGEPLISGRPLTTARNNYTIVPRFPHEDLQHRLSNGAIGPPGQYEVTFVLAIPGMNVVQEQSNFPEMMTAGDSLLEVQADTPDMAVIVTTPESGDQGQIITIGTNTAHRVSSLSLVLEAATFEDAATRAHDVVMPILSRWSFLHDVGMTTSVTQICELATSTRNWTHLLRGTVKAFSDNTGSTTAEVRHLLATYREGISSTEPLFQALSLYKVAEGVYSVRRQRMEAILANENSYRDPGERIPLQTSMPQSTRFEIELMDALKPYAGKKYTQVIDELRGMLRNAIAHLDPDSDPLTADSYDNLKQVYQTLPVLKFMSRILLAREIPAMQNVPLLTLMWMLGLPWRAHSPSSVGVFGAQMAA